MAWNLRLKRLQQILKRSLVHQSTSSHQSQQKIISVNPRVSSFDEKIHIKLQGLCQQVKITVLASTETEWRRKTVQFVSCGHYVTNNAGEVDLWKDASVGGTYTGVDPMGLFWSVRPSPSDPCNTRVVVKNVEQPILYHLAVYLDHLTLEDLDPKMTADQARYQPVSTFTLERTVMPAAVRRIPVREGTVRGTLFIPPGQGPFPGVIDMFGLAGGLNETRAALLASHGFAAFALPFYRHDDLPDTLDHLNFEYFENAVNWVSSHPSVKPGGIGMVGVSGGGALVTFMAWKCPEIKAVVQINAVNALPVMDMYYKGELMCRGLRVDMSKAWREDGGISIKYAWENAADRCFPIWERDVHLLILVSEDDQQMPSEIGDWQRSCYPPNRRHLVELVTYSGAGHLLEPPYTPHCRACYNPFFDGDLLWGGNVKDHAIAQEDSWHRILKFLQTHLSSTVAPHA